MPPPPFGSRREGKLACGRGVEGVPISTMGHTLWCSINTLCRGHYSLNNIIQHTALLNHNYKKNKNELERNARCRETNLENDILVVFELNHHVSRLPVHIPRLNQLSFLFILHLIVLLFLYKNLSFLLSVILSKA